MKETMKLSLPAVERKTERGAALLTMLLISTLLLAAGGALVMTTGVSNTTAIDSTAEVQAYYGAESGLQAALNVLRGNVAPGGGLAAGTQMGFRSAVTRNVAGNFAADPNIQGYPTRLSKWLTYGNDSRVLVNAGWLNYSAYSLEVSDADDPNGALLAADPNYVPRRLIVRSTGFGPKGATKRMEMMVTRVDLNFTERALLAMRSSDPDPVTGLPGPTMTFDIGNSNAKQYSGHDNYGGSTVVLPTFGVTSLPDKIEAELSITKGSTVQGPKVQLVPLSDLPPWLATANKAREFLNDLEAVARANGSYRDGFSGVAGSNAEPAFTFVDGNCDLDGGAGLLVVTGTLRMNGNPNFNGLVLVLGGGRVERDGGGNGTVLGSMLVAAFDRTWPAAQNNLPHPFLAPRFSTGGGGNSDLFYNSDWVRRARNVLGMRVRDVREY
jgi:hypothetical protein